MMRIIVLFIGLRYASDECINYEEYGFADYDQCMKSIVTSTVSSTSMKYTVMTKTENVVKPSTSPANGLCDDYMSLGYTTYEGKFIFGNISHFLVLFLFFIVIFFQIFYNII